MTPNPLRGIGPLTFLSYSYADKALATELANKLEERGLRVHKEDETTLLGRPLSETLAKRIGKREVFIQLLTKTASASTWVQKEFTWAKARADEGRVFRLIPVVADKTNLPEAIANDYYEDAGGGITEELLDRIKRRSLETVQLLPLEPPFEFERCAAEQFLRDAIPGGRRVIVDPDSQIFAVQAALLNFVREGEQRNDESVVNYITDQCAAALRRVEMVDQVAPWLFAQLHAQLRWRGDEFPSCAIDAVNRFCRMTIGDILLELHRLLPGGNSEFLSRFADQLDTACTCIERAQKVDPGKVELGKRLWRVAGQYESYEHFAEVRFFSNDPEQVPFLVFPTASLGGEAWKERIRSGDAAYEILSPGDWANYGVPQIAAQAVALLYANGPSESDPQASRDRLKDLGWELTSYRRLGL